MTYSIDAILEGIATVLSESGYTDIYISQTQQGVNTPCFFISLMPGTFADEVDGRYMDDLGFDVVFLQKPNTTNAMDEIYRVLMFLNENLATIPYTDDEDIDPIPMHTYGREYHIEDMDLHCTFHIKNRVHISKTSNYMQTLEELNHEIKERIDS